jgi:DNA gyrase subunit A
MPATPSASRSRLSRAARGGKGRNAAATKDEDFIDQLWLVNTHDTLLTFTSSGRVFWLPVHQLPDAGPNARGRPIINWMPLEEGEKVQAVLPVREYDDEQFVFFATRNGTVKKTPLTEFAYRLARGKIAINLDEGDALVGVALTDGQRDIMLFASNGKTVRFDEGQVRADGPHRDRRARHEHGQGRGSGQPDRGRIGGRDPEVDDDVGDEVVETDEEAVIETATDVVEVDDGDCDILTATENGYGKRTPLADYPRKGRGTQGVIGIQTTRTQRQAGRRGPAGQTRMKCC